MAGVVASLAAVIGLTHFSRYPLATATLVGTDLAAVTIAVTVLRPLAVRWWKSRGGAAAQVSTSAQAAAAADWLAEEIGPKWRLEAAQRRIVTPVPATIRWRWAAEDLTVPRTELTTPPAPGTGPLPLSDFETPGELLESGLVTRLCDEVYARLPHGRLVLLGAPGAGKTGAMLLLLLAALDRRVSQTGGQGVPPPVPVWLTMGGWNPATSLHDWAVATMNRDYPALRAPAYGPDVAGELLRGGRIALFLDGLDEVPEGVRAQALKRIGDEAQG